MKKIILLFALLSLMSGCAQYAKTGKWAPDGFNLTDYHALGTPVKGDTVAAGFSWSLK